MMRTSGVQDDTSKGLTRDERDFTHWREMHLAEGTGISRKKYESFSHCKGTEREERMGWKTGLVSCVSARHTLRLSQWKKP